MTLQKRIQVAKGEKPADLVIQNARVINVFSEEIYRADIAVTDGFIVGIGTGYQGNRYLNVKGVYVSPAFIDGHVHLESSMVLPKEFARAVLPAGTTTVITDPHEIANVYGLKGIRFMLKATEKLPLSVYFMLPSCVPATPFETSGYTLNVDELKTLIHHPRVLGLAEMMNAVGTINGDTNILDKINMAVQAGKLVDGHAPLLSGKDLNAYIVAHIRSDHECTNVAEAVEKIRLGMQLMVREGTAAKDLDALMPVLKKYPDRCCFVTDDRHPSDLKEHINGMVRHCVASKMSPIKAIQCASLNTARYFGLTHLGAVAPGYRADLLILDDLISFRPKMVLKNGEIVAQNGKCLVDMTILSPHYASSMNVKKLSIDSFKIAGTNGNVKTIGVTDGKLVTDSLVSKALVQNGHLVSNVKTDTLKICVIERHHKTGNIGKGFIKGFQLKSGAIASTVAHDSHNLIVIGTNDTDMYIAAQALIQSGGGKVVVKDGKIMAQLPLPIAGLISNDSLDNVLKNCQQIKKAGRALGCALTDPFMTMGFVSLSVIPNLKITDKGLFDYRDFSFVDLAG